MGGNSILPVGKGESGSRLQNRAPSFSRQQLSTATRLSTNVYARSFLWHGEIADGGHFCCGKTKKLPVGLTKGQSMLEDQTLAFALPLGRANSPSPSLVSCALAERIATREADPVLVVTEYTRVVLAAATKGGKQTSRRMVASSQEGTR